MYQPKYYKNNNREEQLEFIRKNSFGMLINEVDNKPWVTHIPFSLSEDGTKLTSHISRGNVQWKHFSSEKEVMVVFTGPHAYVSSSWYNHENVPTWNYMAVHVYGNIRIIEGNELKASLKQLMDHYEADSERPVSMEKMTPSYLEKEIRSIVAFEITITQIEAAFKLSQNREKEDYENIIDELNKKEDSNAHEVAKEMKKRCPY
ncbi:MAG: FMN-binding negative transcriptional regulator [Cyclobacteriaceae bacterium]